jgi:hypothetical protein
LKQELKAVEPIITKMQALKEEVVVLEHETKVHHGRLMELWDDNNAWLEVDRRNWEASETIVWNGDKRDL